MPNRFLIFLSIVACVLSFFLLPHKANAHGFSYGVVKTQLTAQENKLEFFTTVSESIPVYADNPQAAKVMVENYFIGAFRIRQGDQECVLSLTSYDHTTVKKQSSYQGFFTCPQPIADLDSLIISSTVFTDFFGQFDHFVLLTMQEESFQMVFNAQRLDFPGDVEAVPATSSAWLSEVGQQNVTVSGEGVMSIAQQFLLLGVKHIWTGYDHILFLLCVILLVREPKKIITLVTSFTIAHSVTLILAGLHIITLPPALVEPIIALSIVYLAGRNIFLLKHDQELTHLSERWFTTFGFGLIHGLGFAGSLVQVDIPQTFFFPALLIFNVGIELGQLALLLVIVPILFQVDKIQQRKKVLLGASLCVALLAGFWLVQRLLALT